MIPDTIVSAALPTYYIGAEVSLLSLLDLFCELSTYDESSIRNLADANIRSFIGLGEPLTYSTCLSPRRLCPLLGKPIQSTRIYNSALQDSI